MHIEVYTYGVNVERAAKVRLDGQRKQKKKNKKWQKKEKCVKHNLTNYRLQKKN